VIFLENEQKKEGGESISEDSAKIPEQRNNLTEEKPISDKVLVFSAVFIIVLLALFFVGFSYFKQEPKTIEELHILNIEGKLNEKRGYMYKGVYSFITLDNVWYTQLKSPSGSKLYDIAFRYSPKDIEGIKIIGGLNKSLFDDDKSIYVTFDPSGKDFSHVALAVGDFDTHMIKSFGKEIIAACDKNGTDECKERPIINCTNTDKPVLYVKEDEKSELIYENNCIIVQGNGFDLVKGVDRALFDFYGIMTD